MLPRYEIRELPALAPSRTRKTVEKPIVKIAPARFDPERQLLVADLVRDEAQVAQRAAPGARRWRGRSSRRRLLVARRPPVSER